MSFAVVRRIVRIEPHPDETRTKIEVIVLDNETKLVTGKHYRAGLLGIHLRPGALIPGWLAEDLWLVGRKRAREWFEVRSINIFGVESPGLFCGAEYLKDASEASELRFQDLKSKGAVQLAEGWITWPAWREHWHAGLWLDGYLGVVPVPQVVLAKVFGEDAHRPLAVTSSGLDVTGAASSTYANSAPLSTAAGNPPPVFPPFDHLVPRD